MHTGKTAASDGNLNGTPGGLVAFLSDIHGNFDALEAVLEDMENFPVEQVYCLGDMVGYGPAPGACVARIRELCAETVLGNHELMMLMLAWRTLTDLGSELTPSLRLALSQLSKADINWISARPLEHTYENFCIVHSTFYQPATFHYIQDFEDAELCLANQPGPLCFHGHTHVPVIWEQCGRDVHGIHPDDTPFRLQKDSRYSINVGSVGQPRDCDPRAAYCLYNPAEHSVIHRRVEYDIARAQERFRQADMRPFDLMRIAVGD
jgi:predicted phosphodiesterase